MRISSMPRKRHNRSAGMGAPFANGELSVFVGSPKVSALQVELTAQEIDLSFVGPSSRFQLRPPDGEIKMIEEREIFSLRAQPKACRQQRLWQFRRLLWRFRLRNGSRLDWILPVGANADIHHQIRLLVGMSLAQSRKCTDCRRGEGAGWR
jgi:hypothetical protein